jgi:hypothetical protein
LTSEQHSVSCTVPNGHHRRATVCGTDSNISSVAGSVLVPLPFRAYVSDSWRNIECNIRLFADDCIIYRKLVGSADSDKLQTDVGNGR